MFVRRWILIAGGALAALAGASAAVAQGGYEGADPPARVGRLAEARGTVWAFDAEEGQWTQATPNRPLIEGDRLSVDDDGHAELRIGPTVLRLAGGTEIELRRLDDEHMQFELLGGALALRVPTREHVRQIELITDQGRFRPLRPGHYRFDREGEVTHAAAWRGELEFEGRENLLRIEAGERYRVWLDGRRGYARTQSVPMPSDRLAAWALAADRAAAQTAAAYRYVSPEMTGAEDLDRYGNWVTHPEFGFVWVPDAVPAGWAPYRDGRWVWMLPWGWTWVDAAPWGFAPSHYGRWVSWRGRWVWWPGPRHVRPVFAPALVSRVGGPEVGVSLTIDLGSRYASPVSWMPLAPYQPYLPIYRAPPKRHGPPPPRPGHRPPPPRQVPTGPISYGPDGVPAGVSPVPAGTLAPSQPAAAVAPAQPRAGSRPDARRAPLPVARPRDPALRPPPSAEPAPSTRADGQANGRANGRATGRATGRPPSGQPTGQPSGRADRRQDARAHGRTNAPPVAPPVPPAARAAPDAPRGERAAPPREAVPAQAPREAAARRESRSETRRHDRVD